MANHSIYKPFKHPWAYDAWLMQQRLMWLPEEVSMSEDIQDWHYKITPQEKNLLTQIFRFFTQSDIEVHSCYTNHYGHISEATEVKMMLTAFANIETVHIAGYSYLLDTLGIDESEYSAFLKYKEMRDKYDYMQKFSANTPRNTALTIAAFSVFTEGLQLFASFAILLNFPRFNKMKGMGQIISWSVRDETLHTLAMIRLFHTFMSEHQGLWDDGFKQEISTICTDIIYHEDAFIDLAFEMGDVQGLTAEEMKLYIRYIADRRTQQLNVEPIFGIEKNPLPWIDDFLNGVEFANFFETRATEYSKAATKGTWEDAFRVVCGL